MPTAQRRPEPVPFVYILAASHSGSTLLALLLATHPEICTAGELKLCALGETRRYRCSCGRLILECEFWSDVRAEMKRRGFEFDLAHAGTDIREAPGAYARALLRPLHRGPLLERCRDVALAASPGWWRHYREAQARNEAVAASVCTLTGSRVIVDSSKNGVRLKYLLRNPGLDVRVVRLLRDGRAVALTYIDPEQFADAADPRLKGGGMGDSRARERLAPAAAAYQWRRAIEDMDHAFARVPPDRRIDLRYEDLCTNVDASLERLFRFAGVNPGARREAFRATDVHVVGNGMRLDRSAQVVVDDRWRTALSTTDLKTFESVAGDVNIRLGYA